MPSMPFDRLLHKLMREYKQHMEEHLAPQLTAGQFQVMEYMLTNEGPFKPSDMLDYLATTPAAVTTLLDRMERGGLIQRQRDEKDRRIVWIAMTRKGREAGEHGMELKNQFFQTCLDRISSHNQQLLLFLLNKVVHENGSDSSGNP
ncbi:MarR family winged helix-turn-helix transcriptional regulator [Marinicrinis sediminis]|uniref:MarR family winged helix-turn-helix transcriptional regulator n=1 Tax=Marinicrinis sediminis TaxID=1652465 RepID=A0ABW5RD44_9BACL